MLKVKDGVRLFGLIQEILWAADRCVDVFAELAGVDVVITSARGDRHSRASLHYIGAAIDIRTREMNDETIRAVISRLKQVLGKDFDVIFEGNHIHIEYQPKGANDYLTVLAA